MAIPEIIAKKKMKRYEPMTDNMFLIPLIIFIKTLPHFPFRSHANKIIKPFDRRQSLTIPHYHYSNTKKGNLRSKYKGGFIRIRFSML